MKKHVLEKLLHTHNLLRLGDKRGYEKFTELYRPLPHISPRHAENKTSTVDLMGGFSKEEKTINYVKLRELF